MMEETDAPRFPWEDDEAVARPPDPAAAGQATASELDRDSVTAEAAEAAPQAEAVVEPPAGATASSAAGGGHAPGRRTETAQRPLVPKEYYSISEVADLVGLPAHVLRYWESQFSVLNPSKNRSGNRVYQRKEIRLIMLVKKLLHDEKYTVEGARQKLDQLRRGADLAGATSHALDEQVVQTLRDDLLAVSELLRIDTE